jgi:hypothetical protein
VLGGLLVVGQRPELVQAEADRVVDQPVDLQPVVDEAAVEEPAVLLGLRVGAVVPEVRGEIVVVVLARAGVDVFEQALEGPDEGEADPLDDSGMLERERGWRPPRR